MKSVSLSVIKNLVNLPHAALRRRYERCCLRHCGYVKARARRLPRISVGRMVVSILENEYKCTDLNALHEELVELIDSPDEPEERDHNEAVLP